MREDPAGSRRGCGAPVGPARGIGDLRDDAVRSGPWDPPGPQVGSVCARSTAAGTWVATLHPTLEIRIEVRRGPGTMRRGQDPERARGEDDPPSRGGSTTLHRTETSSNAPDDAVTVFLGHWASPLVKTSRYVPGGRDKGNIRRSAPTRPQPWRGALGFSTNRPCASSRVPPRHGVACASPPP